MKKLSLSNERGVGHLGIILAVVVVAAVAGAGWFVWQKQHKPSAAGNDLDAAVQEAIKNAKCDYDDKDLCKFFTGQKAQPYYTVTATTKGGEADGQTNKFEADGDSKSHIVLAGATNYEIVVIGDATYTKAADGTWWKQTVPQDQVTKLKDTDPTTSLEEPAAEGDTKDTTVYKKLGKEACGKLTCFRYEQTDSSDATIKNSLWFDDEDYLLRRSLTILSEGVTYDSLFSYDKVSISVPSPVKDLAPNQYLVPGQNEPVTLPAAGDGTPTPEELQQLIDQYQQ